MRICKQSRCGKKHNSHGYCANHARQYRKWGRIRSKEELSEEVATRNKNTKPALGKKWSTKAKANHSKRLKGRRLNTGRTHFKTGHTPWLKGTKNLIQAWNKGVCKYSPDEAEYNKAQRSIFRRFRVRVIERDNSICQVCSVFTELPQVDHIQPWATNPELRFELSNCRTVCMPCHYYITYKRKIPQGLYWGSRRQTQ